MHIQSPSESSDSQALPATVQRDASWPVPEILAPAGGRAQFFAALQSGADAVFLGLKNFNARGRAENFSMEDLRELLPLARKEGMRVLVTLNILLKDAELPTLVEELSELQSLGIEALIIQDLGVARLIRQQFPQLRMHASTQMAVHNKAGVLAAAALGFKRVVLARELTAQEIRRIRREVPRELIEIEAFCHGSLCYSYSGLCFFSGAEDARSGNRGECAYTCRKPYQILNEPGHGFLFSMKDLDTSLDLDKLVFAGVDTLKIEGRKKDAQYVASTVGLYRQRLNEIFGRDTSRRPMPATRDFRRDMAYSFHRDRTSFFVKGRYHENVIDLNNPTHQGVPIGKVLAQLGRTIELESSEALERFDGLRIDRPQPLYHAKPQHGSEVKGSPQRAQRKYENDGLQFSLRSLMVNGRSVHECEAGTRVRIELPASGPLPQVGDQVFKVRSNELKRYTEHLAQAPEGTRLRPLELIAIAIEARQVGEELELALKAHVGDRSLLHDTLQLPALRPDKSAHFERDLLETFRLFGDAGLEAELSLSGDLNWFVPKKALKAWKQDLQHALTEGLRLLKAKSLEAGLAHLKEERGSLRPAQAEASYQIKIDRLEYLPWIAQFRAEHPEFVCDEIVFEPKRAFLHQTGGQSLFAELFTFCRSEKLGLRLALPTVIRAWDEALLRVWIEAFARQGGTAYELGNVGAWAYLASLGHELSQLDLSSDFTLYGLNTEAIAALRDVGIMRYALSVEDDATSIEEKLSQWPLGAGEPQIILYKDTPLFIAEACSLTALHHGCPGSQVCGYRTLEIANDKGERFFVAHETCKSIVYGAEAFSWTQHKEKLFDQGIRRFRLDFLTRSYSEAEMSSILRSALAGATASATQSANFSRRLL